MSRAKITIEVDGIKKTFHCDKFMLVRKKDSDPGKVKIDSNVFDDMELSMMILPLVEKLNGDMNEFELEEHR
jgi:hypothetical protein